ncbi:MAG: response regulator [Candidatus Margulisiibacteriota bacterium]
MSKTILVVDDDQSITSIFEFILGQAGYKTLSASSGQTCLDLLASHPTIDLVFLDVKMPGMSGIETFKEIQKINPTLLVVMMTGYSIDELLKEAFELGAYGVIYKPFDVEEVLSIVGRLFKAPRK